MSYDPILTNADGTPYEPDVYGDPEAVLARVEKKVDALNDKVDKVVELANLISEEVQPLIQKVMESPMFKMLVGGK